MNNILYLHMHDMGRFNSLYGYAADTPNMLAFARGATVFQNAYCACPTCSPSRAALTTGLMPHTNGMIGLAHRGFSLNDPKRHLSHYLRGQGYHTALFGVQHEAADPATLGYDTIAAPDGPLEQRDRASAQAAAEYLSKAECPFFLAVGFFYPHRPYLPHGDIDPDFVRVPPCLPDNEDTRADYADYLASVREADRCCGIVLDALRASGRWDDTIVVLTTDHGIAFPHMKCNLYDTGIGVTLAVKAAGQTDGRRLGALVSHLDIFPTLCDALALAPPEGLQGVSLRPLLEGDCLPPRKYVFCEVTYHAAYEPMRCVRSERYKLIRRYDREYTRTVMPNIDDGLSKRFLMEYGLSGRERAPLELYDLFFDPNERNNLACSPAYARVLEELEAALDQEMFRTGDPYHSAPNDRYPAPFGARINRRECTHPTDSDFE